MPLYQSHCLCRRNLELVAVARMLHIYIAAASDNFCGQRIHCPKPGQVTSHRQQRCLQPGVLCLLRTEAERCSAALTSAAIAIQGIVIASAQRHHGRTSRPTALQRVSNVAVAPRMIAAASSATPPQAPPSHLAVPLTM